jgi:hypothetical protein
MRTVFIQALLVSVASLAMAADSKGAELGTSSSAPENHVVVNSRPLSKKLQNWVIEERKREIEESVNPPQVEEVQLSGLIIPIKTQNEFNFSADAMNLTTASFSPFLYHWIDYFPQNNVIKIEDGSEWIFDENDAYILRTWRPGDTVVVAPKTKWLWGSNYSYVMMNKDLGTAINVNLYLGPIKNGQYTTWVVGLNPSQSQVYLINGHGERTVWEIAQADFKLFQEWAVNDTVIIGENDYWLSWLSPHNYLIINVNMNHNVRARHVQSIPNMRKPPVSAPVNEMGIPARGA